MGYQLFLSAIFFGLAIWIIAGVPALETYRILYMGTIVKATICDKWEKHGRTYLTWSYTVNGLPHIYTSRHGFKRETRKIGDKGALLLKRGHADKVYDLRDPDDKIGSMLLGILLLIGAALTAAAAVRTM